MFEPRAARRLGSEQVWLPSETAGLPARDRAPACHNLCLYFRNLSAEFFRPGGVQTLFAFVNYRTFRTTSQYAVNVSQSGACLTPNTAASDRRSIPVTIPARSMRTFPLEKCLRA